MQNLKFVALLLCISACDGGGQGESDTEPPVITLLGDNPVSVAQNTPYTDVGATAVDNVDGNLTAAILATNTVNPAVVGAYTVTYNVSDAAGNAATPVTRMVNVVAPAGWTPRSSGTTNALLGVVWSGTQFVVVGVVGTVLTSPDGVTWTSQVSGTSLSLTDVAWDGAQFVAVGGSFDTEGTILTSPDGVTWTPRDSGVGNRFDAVTWSGTQFVAVGGPVVQGDPALIVTSPDGVTWTPRTPGTINQLLGVVWSGTQFVAVGQLGTIMTSPDGLAWTPQDVTATEFLLTDVTWSGTQFVTVGFDGALRTSQDGITWTTRDAGAAESNLQGINWNGAQFVVVGGSDTSGTILSSADGIAWTPQAAGTEETLIAVTWSAELSRLVVVGIGGVILTSP